MKNRERVWVQGQWQTMDTEANIGIPQAIRTDQMETHFAMLIMQSKR